MEFMKSGKIYKQKIKTPPIRKPLTKPPSTEPPTEPPTEPQSTQPVIITKENWYLEKVECPYCKCHVSISNRGKHNNTKKHIDNVKDIPTEEVSITWKGSILLKASK